MKCPFKEEDYLHSKKELINHVIKNGFDSIAEFSSLTGMPLVIAYRFVSYEIKEFKDDCEFKIKSLEHFYGYRS